ncbi:MAG: phosphodiesterase, partial [Firmicutes bacterium]|nr:phosphodiesterase [Bacillota bacterium]
MRWIIGSDLHGSAEYTKLFLERVEAEKADRILLLGDILYHGPRNALPSAYGPMQVFEMLNAYKDRILCVRGNCDAEVDQNVLEFPI